MTRPYAEVIGDPIAHSKSPLIHKFWLAKLGIDADYRATRVAPDGLGAYIAERAADPGWRGCNVTIPHKVAVLDHIWDPHDVRSVVGSANTVFRANSKLVAANTDVMGFFSPLAKVDLRGKAIAVVGTGGAARAVLFALAFARLGPVTILARSPVKAMGLLDEFALEGEAVPLTGTLPEAALLVNATSLGMTGQPPLDLDLSPLQPHAIVYDIVYAPLETPLLAAAHARGLNTIDGLEMLVGQAAGAFELFFGNPAPREHDDELRALLVRA